MASPDGEERDISVLPSTGSSIDADNYLDVTGEHLAEFQLYRGPPSDVQPASYHALNYAYNDLKNRFNELQEKHLASQRQLRSKSLPRGGATVEEPDTGNGMDEQETYRVASPGVSGGHGRVVSRSGIVSRDIGHQDTHMDNNMDRHTDAPLSPPIINGQAVNGDLGIQLYAAGRDNPRLDDRTQIQISSQLKELELTKSRLKELEKRTSELQVENESLRSKLAENESVQSISLEQAQRYNLSLDNENEDLRKRNVALEKRSRFLEQEKIKLEQDKIHLEHIKTAKEGQAEEFRQEAKTLRASMESMRLSHSAPVSPQMSAPSALMPEDDGLENVERVCAQLRVTREEMKRLKETVWKQNEVIRMLIGRHRMAQAGGARRLSNSSSQSDRGSNSSLGQGARPKLRPHSTVDLPHSLGNADDEASKDTPVKPFRKSTAGRRPKWQSDPGLGDSYEAMTRSPRRSGARSGEFIEERSEPRDPRDRPLINDSLEFPKDIARVQSRGLEQHDDPRSEESAVPTRESGLVARESGIVARESGLVARESRSDLRLRDDAENLQMPITEELKYYLHEEDKKKVNEMLARYTNMGQRQEAAMRASQSQEYGAGYLYRNDSLEHLHDDTPSHQNMEDLEDIYVGHEGREYSPEEEQTMLAELDSPERINIAERSSLERNNQRESSNSPANIENRYRAVASSNQPRPINIERNETDSYGASARSYDNTIQNVNINTSSDKFRVPSQHQESFPILNNDPIVGNKTIPSKNIFQEETDVGVYRGTRVPPVESPGNEREAALCPMCNDMFPRGMSEAEIHEHVMHCGTTEADSHQGGPHDERVCPMCSAVFPDNVSQHEFEQHVNEHFEDNEVDSQFVVLRP